MSLLEVSGLKVAYGGIQAVKGIDLRIESGELIALIGANGAGKSSTLKTLAGMHQPADGAVIYNGERIDGVGPHLLIRKGLALVPEGRGVFSRLTVEDNLLMGAYCRNDNTAIQQELAQVYELFQRLFERREQLAGTLSGGEQQMLAIGRALLGKPKLLLLDEPSMGLSPILVQKIFDTVRRIAAQGVTILLVEQNAKLALEVSSRGYVMESGLITLAGPAQDLLHDPRVRAAYLGG
ncbi:MAG: ABC transporter ATP-binding protein [Burkholderiales bacterium]